MRDSSIVLDDLEECIGDMLGFGDEIGFAAEDVHAAAGEVRRFPPVKFGRFGDFVRARIFDVVA